MEFDSYSGTNQMTFGDTTNSNEEDWINEHPFDSIEFTQGALSYEISRDYHDLIIKATVKEEIATNNLVVMYFTLNPKYYTVQEFSCLQTLVEENIERLKLHELWLDDDLILPN
jgi:hypothetical protein